MLYLDPSSASLIVQVVVAGVVGAGAAVRLYWGRLASFVRRDRTSPPSP